VHQFGRDLTDVDSSWARLHGVDADGAVLVRPDGHIAWRSRRAVARPESALATVLNRVLARW
jgi:hypothetical protein